MRTKCWTIDPTPMDGAVGSKVIKRRDLGSGFPGPHDGECISVGAGQEDREEDR